ncbi:hypothetical protein [Flavisolibacter tropicus]|uniref:Lipoprotein n=1 Tax=Flavisolibacter tropicus TaxID=1492898 RepID=A0A172TQM5_9BACT|nr:hypothetical protein [Flavisolibacter tropicus]ANE49330.1 hypothetical protein SY85_01245 [Flavisolibacter tropicus]
MKPILFYFLAVFCLLTGCKKENAIESFYIKHKVDGVVKEYKIAIVASKNKIGNEYYFVLSGRRTLNTNQTIIVDFADGSPIVERTYQQNDNFEYHIAYGDENNNLYTTQRVTNPQVNVTITKLSGSTVRGSFSGRVYDDFTNKYVTITEGEFYAELQ